MSRVQEKIPAMFALAHQRTEASRIELAGLVANLFLNSTNELTLRENEQVNELIEQLMRNNSPALRAQLVNSFADTTHMPRTIAVSLCTSPIDVAAKVLTRCETLTDQDLITVVENQSRDHAVAVAYRQSINEAVADALITTGDIHIMQIVAENLGAKLSTKAINAVVDAARFTATLREPAMNRPEMYSSAALKLYWWVSHDLRRAALKRFGISASEIDEALAKTIEEMLGFHQLDKNNLTVMNQIADWLQERQALSARILPQVLRLGHFQLFKVILSRLVGLDLTLIDHIVTAPGGRELAAICRALGIDKSGFVSIFLLSRGARPDDHLVHPRELHQALFAFDRLTTNLANDLLRTWVKDPSYLTRAHDDDMVLEA